MMTPRAILARLWAVALVLMSSSALSADVSMLIIEADSTVVNEAVKGLDLPREIEVRFFTHKNIAENESARAFIAGSETIIVDVMMPELNEYLLQNEDPGAKPVYALRGSRNDQKLKDRGFIFDPEIQAYFSNLSAANIQNLIKRVVHEEIDPSVTFQDVQNRPDVGIAHPEAKEIFSSLSAYRSWYEGLRKDVDRRPWLGLMFFSSSLIPGQKECLDELILRIEEAGWNVLPCFGQDEEVLTRYLLNQRQEAEVNAVLAFSLKFYSAMNEGVKKALSELDVPVFNAINLYGQTLPEWRQDPRGIPPMHVVWTMANPEISGLIEPTPLSGPVRAQDPQTGREVTRYELIKENLDLVLPRLKTWLQLREMDNRDKRVAILYYNHSQGKQNIGASYLNVFRSLQVILERMRTEGYRVVEKDLITEEELKELILKTGRNVGSWAPGELDAMLADGTVIRLPVSTYMSWFKTLPREFRQGVVEQWGPVEDSTIMIKGGDLIIPGVRMGQVMLTDIPNLYPYIVDDVGEGIQAKRRGRGVIIDHLIPPLRKGGLYGEYSRLYDLINSFNRSKALDSETAQPKLKEIQGLSVRLGLTADLGLDDMDDEALEEIEHHLLEIRENLMPYGLHTYGRSPRGEPLEETAQAVAEINPDAEVDVIRQGLTDSGPLEIDRLMQGLEGRFIPAGEGNDPIRNPGAIPTGKNFYGFDPEKISSESAWTLGKQAARQIIEESVQQNGTMPEKVAVALWATETIRNEGVNESTILSLMGLRPVWDSAGRVTGTRVIPGPDLGRPRIDVLINPSGLYRDLFPGKLLFLDRAVRKAALQTDIANLIQEHSGRLKKRLMDKGLDEQEAETLSTIRIFSEKAGSYGTGVSEMTGNSGFWESDQEIVEVYENRVGYAFGQGLWGKPARELFKLQLSDVDTAVHSRSSNVYGMMDNDDMFQYLGGLSLAVRRESGQTPDPLITRQQVSNDVQVEDAARTLGRELRTRNLNPKWIQGMKEEDYAGAGEMAQFVEYMWGWQVTVPETVDAAKWEQTYEVYVQDKHGQDLKAFFNRASPWAYQSITARMLEAARKGYWEADVTVRKKLAADYALNVVEKGAACCDHTCNNPLLNQMVVNIISLPGVMSPEMVEEFKLALEQAMGEKLDQQVQDRQILQAQLSQSLKDADQGRDEQQTRKTGQGSKREDVKGYTMEEVTPRDEASKLTSSGVQWFATLGILVVVALFVVGGRRRRSG